MEIEEEKEEDEDELMCFERKSENKKSLGQTLRTKRGGERFKVGNMSLIEYIGVKAECKVINTKVEILNLQPTQIYQVEICKKVMREQGNPKEEVWNIKVSEV